MPEFRTTDRVLAGCAVVLIIAATIATFTVHTVMRDVGQWIAFSGAVAATLMWLLSIYLLGKARAQYEQANTLEERLHGWRLVREAGARCLGKLYLASALDVLYLARVHAVLLFLRVHPLTLYMLLIVGIGILTLNEIGEVSWYRFIYPFLARRRKIAEQLVVVTNGEQQATVLHRTLPEDGNGNGKEDR